MHIYNAVLHFACKYTFVKKMLLGVVIQHLKCVCKMYYHEQRYCFAVQLCFSLLSSLYLPDHIFFYWENTCDTLSCDVNIRKMFGEKFPLYGHNYP